MHFKYLSVVFICIFLAIEASSQIIVGSTDDLQRSNVGLVDEFMKRFNGTELHPVISTQDSSARKKNIAKLIAVDQMPGDRDSVLNQALKFIDDVIRNSVTLDYSDSTWVALAKCCGKLANNSVTFNLYLNVERRKEDMYKWVIAKAEGHCFGVYPRDTSDKIILYPDDHETRFISLNRMTSEQPYNVQKFMSKGVAYDATSTFMYLIHSGELEIDYVDNLEFIFTQVPGYVFHINYLERDASQSGWLITKFYPATDARKEAFLKSLYMHYPTDTISLDNELSLEKDTMRVEYKAKRIFEDRILERVQLLKDYISLVMNNGDTEGFYKKKLVNLFSSNASVYISNDSSDLISTLSIPDFYEFLLRNKGENLRLTSIIVPVWDKKLECADSGIQLGRVTSKRIFVDDDNIQQSSDQFLLVCKEITEDGYEWVPCFGDVFVVVKDRIL